MVVDFAVDVLFGTFSNGVYAKFSEHSTHCKVTLFNVVPKNFVSVNADGYRWSHSLYCTCHACSITINLLLKMSAFFVRERPVATLSQGNIRCSYKNCEQLQPRFLLLWHKDDTVDIMFLCKTPSDKSFELH